MSLSWFFNPPPSRSAIENEVRLSFWRVGLGAVWFTCAKESAPIECAGFWGEKEFALEWEPKNYLLLKMPAPDQDVLSAFERVLKRKALAAYRNDAGKVVVEWRAKNSDARFDELKAGGVKDLERLDK